MITQKIEVVYEVQRDGRKVLHTGLLSFAKDEFRRLKGLGGKWRIYKHTEKTLRTREDVTPPQ